MTQYTREQMREYKRRRRREWKDAGVCTMCGTYKAIAGYVVCQKCLDRQNTYYPEKKEDS